MSGGRRPITYKKIKMDAWTSAKKTEKMWDLFQRVSGKDWEISDLNSRKFARKKIWNFLKKNKENSEFEQFKMFYRIKSDILRLISDIFYKKTPKFLIWKVKELWNKIGNLPDKNKKIYEF